MGLKINYNNPLPDEYEREMPSGLNPMEILRLNLQLKKSLVHF